jgi:hypothetical protein
LTVRFPTPVQPATVKITASTAEAAAEAGEGTPVPGTVSYDASSHSATFTPAGELVPLATYKLTATARTASGRPVKAVVWEYTAPRPVRTDRPERAPSRPPASPVVVVTGTPGLEARRTTAVPVGR